MQVYNQLRLFNVIHFSKRWCLVLDTGSHLSGPKLGAHFLGILLCFRNHHVMLRFLQTDGLLLWGRLTQDSAYNVPGTQYIQMRESVRKYLFLINK